MSSTTRTFFATGAAPFAHRLYETGRTLTIIREPQSPDHRPGDADTLALSALGWVLADEARGERLLSLTGLTPDVLRARLTDRTVLSAVLEFLCNDEPDLLLAADALNVPPERLVEAHEELAR